MRPIAIVSPSSSDASLLPGCSYPSTKMAKIAGTFNMTSSEGFDDFMKEIGVGMMMRKLGSTSKPEVTFAQKGDEWTMKTSTAMKTTEIKFMLGQEFDESTVDGRECKTTFTMEGDNLVQLQKSKGKEVKYTRSFSDTEMTMVCESNGVKCSRVYKRA
ncbi:unnamed protein product [Meganyctiphanes norvegica]|uniref:Cytosolic fatty-acid binding proteins domain-containing protein n=1 Tax=Meganyctiphanes norvegica TaxID=48144 RepID=A0AAV2QG92_MEGNR